MRKLRFLKYNCLLKTLKYWNLIAFKRLIKHHFFIYAGLECVIEKISTTKVSKHIESGFSISRISSFRSIENKCIYKAMYKEMKII